MTDPDPRAETDASAETEAPAETDATGKTETDATGGWETSTATDPPLVLDVMLGKLATYLRMCGYDAAYAGDRGAEADDDLLALAATEERVLVTRDTDLSERIERSLLLSARDVTDQLRELSEADFELELSDRPRFCSACNGPLGSVDRTEPTPDYAPATYETDVWRCRDCGQHFWKGSHWDDVGATLDSL